LRNFSREVNELLWVSHLVWQLFEVFLFPSISVLSLSHRLIRKSSDDHKRKIGGHFKMYDSSWVWIYYIPVRKNIKNIRQCHFYCIIISTTKHTKLLSITSYKYYRVSDLAYDILLQIMCVCVCDRECVCVFQMECPSVGCLHGSRRKEVLTMNLTSTGYPLDSDSSDIGMQLIELGLTAISEFCNFCNQKLSQSKFNLSVSG